MTLITLWIALLITSIPVLISESRIMRHNGTLLHNHTLVANRKRLPSRNAQPPFAKYLRTSKERQDLLRIIKNARRNRATKEEIQLHIDRFLREHLHDADYRNVVQLRAEGQALNHVPSLPYTF